jgi:hypothetical protein
MKQGRERVEQYLPKVLIDELKLAPPQRQYTVEPLSGGCLLLRPDFAPPTGPVVTISARPIPTSLGPWAIRTARDAGGQVDRTRK